MVQAKQETIDLMHSVAAHTLELDETEYDRLFEEAPVDPTLPSYLPGCGWAKFQTKVLKLLILHTDWGTFREVWWALREKASSH